MLDSGVELENGEQSAEGDGQIAESREHQAGGRRTRKLGI
jgi:hypothetical protein